MIINEKVFLCFVLFIIGAECLRTSSRAYPPQEHFEYYNPQNGFPYGFGHRQGEVQIQNLNRQQPRMQQYDQRQGNGQMQNRPSVQSRIQQERRDPWSFQGSLPASQTSSPPRQPQTTTTPKYMNNDDMWGFPIATSPPTTSSTTTQRFLPHSPNRWSQASTPDSTSSTSTRRNYRKHRIQDDSVQDTYDSNKFIVNGREKALGHIGTNLQPYFLRALVRDFIARLTTAIQANNVLLSQNELLALDNQCTTCSVPELQVLINILLTILEKYPPLNGDKGLAEHVATEYERACDFLNRKLDQLKTETAGLHQDIEFRDLQKRYARRERKGGIMSLLMKWLEDYARNGRDNELELEDKLLKLLTKQKRYWLISIRGIL